jgi:DNA-binding CsgD family transcriptional regulator
MATVRHAPATEENSQCLSCESWASAGGGADPTSCVRGVARAEQALHGERSGSVDQDSCGAMDRMGLASLEALDLLGIGLAVCDASSKLMFSNRTADEILRGRDGLHLNAAGELCTTERCVPSLGQLLERTIQASRSGHPAKQGAALSVRRVSSKRALTLYVRAVGARSEESGPTQEAALVMMLDSTIPARASEADLSQLYGLTSTEARIANLLMEGKTLDECCRELGIQHSTGCSHLKRIFKKTGVHRQSELVSLLLKSIGLLRLNREASDPPRPLDSVTRKILTGMARVSA